MAVFQKLVQVSAWQFTMSEANKHMRDEELDYAKEDEIVEVFGGRFHSIRKLQVVDHVEQPRRNETNSARFCAYIRGFSGMWDEVDDVMYFELNEGDWLVEDSSSRIGFSHMSNNEFDALVIQWRQNIKDNS